MMKRRGYEQVVHVRVKLCDWSRLVGYGSVDDRVGGSRLNKN